MPGDNILHVNAVRLRVTGNGNLKINLYSMDEVKRLALTDLGMASTNSKIPTRLANFQSQAIKLEVKTTEIDEVFKISKITIFAKKFASSYPS